MQIIVRLKCTQEEYLVAQMQSSMSRPHHCPNCRARRSLAALGYYERWLSGADGRLAKIAIRRFRCRICHRTVSLLPDFAQPYRLVRSSAIELYFGGDVVADEVQRMIYLLRCYWRRFVTWLPRLRRALAAHLGLSPPVSKPREWWAFLMDATGSLAHATCRLVAEVRTTVFGRYRCHQPRPS